MTGKNANGVVRLQSGDEKEKFSIVEHCKTFLTGQKKKLGFFADT